MMIMLHLSLNHLSKFRPSHRLLQENYLFSATTLSYFSAAQPNHHFPDPPSSSEHRRGGPAVFLSFRGKDTRRGFVKSLHEALCCAGIAAFKDDVDLKGGRIQRGLMDAIHNSWVFIPVISSNYASSKWCLEELAEIMKCVKMEKRTVFPVFYDVRPTDVRHLKPPFSAAFAQFQDCRKVKVWKRALSEVADFSGFDLIDTYQSFNFTAIMSFSVKTRDLL
ncbi:PREDICTED: TMV resistance protein N-like isoform X2 [Ipomoea nil]|uniref:TMV resistance protein N-like isoform X2 n=1 Tax=Ipomoea nil TaxID=35883 RepID=UPI0009015441|nr:PREDICTED: TMV resistance protein N-like isoform X2 [Ipomoea nil]